MPRLTAKVNLVLTLIPLGFLSVLSLPNLSTPFFRFFATLLSPSKLSRLRDKALPKRRRLEAYDVSSNREGSGSARVYHRRIP